MLLSGCLSAAASSDSIPTMFSRPVHWRIGAELSPAWVPETNVFLKGENPEGKHINASFSGGIRADFASTLPRARASSIPGFTRVSE